MKLDSLEKYLLLDEFLGGGGQLGLSKKKIQEKEKFLGGEGGHFTPHAPPSLRPCAGVMLPKMQAL
jgi:hypothetical protein